MNLSLIKYKSLKALQEKREQKKHKLEPNKLLADHKLKKIKYLLKTLATGKRKPRLAQKLNQELQKWKSKQDNQDLQKEGFRPPFDMLKRAPPRKTSNQAYWGAFDLECVSVPISELSKEDLEFLFDLDVPGFEDENFFSYSSVIQHVNAPCIQLPIAWCFIYTTGDLNSEDIDWDSVVMHSSRIAENFINSKNILQASLALMEEFFVELVDSKNANFDYKDTLYLYGHNAGGYDSYILTFYYLKLDMHKVYKKRLTFKKKEASYLSLNLGQKIQIRDSMQILEGSLNTLSNKMLNLSKLEMPTKRFTFANFLPNANIPISNELLNKYVRTDTVLLFLILLTLEEFVKKHYNTSFYEKLTISSLTVLIYFRHYYNPKLNFKTKQWADGIYTLTSEQNEAIRASYHGGRTEVFCPHLGKGTVYDINSAYVSAMIKKPMPVGRGRGPYPVRDSIGFFHYQLDSFFGFAQAEVFSPANEFSAKALPFTNHRNYLLFPTGNFKGWFFSEELKLAKKQGYLIKVTQTIYFNSSTTLFAPYLDNLSEIRKTYLKGHPYNEVAKRLGNSLYGRFAMKTQSDNYFIAYTETQLKQIMQKNQIKQLTAIKTRSGNTIYSFEGKRLKVENSSDPYSRMFKVKQVMQKVAPQISAAISSYIRMDLAELLYLDVGRNIAYVDTDSAFVKENAFPFESDPSTPGAWKVDSTFDEAIIIAPKLYVLLKKIPNSTEMVELIKARGLTGAYKEQLSSQDILNLLKKDCLDIHISGNVEDGRVMLKGDKLHFFMQEAPRPNTLSAKSMDRICEKVYDNDNNWVLTKPLIVIDGLPATIGDYTTLQIKTRIEFEDYLTTMSKKEYFATLKEIKKLQQQEEALYAELSDPTLLPGHSKIDKKSGFLIPKTAQEVQNSYLLNSENYQILLTLRALNKEQKFPPGPERRQLKQLEVCLDEYMESNNLTEEQVSEKLLEAKKSIQDKIENQIQEYIASKYANKKALNQAGKLINQEIKLQNNRSKEQKKK